MVHLGKKSGHFRSHIEPVSKGPYYSQRSLTLYVIDSRHNMSIKVRYQIELMEVTDGESVVSQNS